jgi:hypothetical protein
MPLPRMTTRPWMFAVAVVAISIQLWEFVRRWPRCDEMISYHSRQSIWHAAMARQAAPCDRVRGMMSSGYHAEMARKWRLARLVPWYAMEPDPADPLNPAR